MHFIPKTTKSEAKKPKIVTREQKFVPALFNLMTHNYENTLKMIIFATSNQKKYKTDTYCINTA